LQYSELKPYGKSNFESYIKILHYFQLNLFLATVYMQLELNYNLKNEYFKNSMSPLM